MRYEKLVRDRIPEIIERAGKTATWRELRDEEFRLALKAKAVEEAEELILASDDALLSELADLSEVIDGILRAYNLSASVAVNLLDDRLTAAGCTHGVTREEIDAAFS